MSFYIIFEKEVNSDKLHFQVYSLYVNGDTTLMQFSLFTSTMVLNPALPFWKMLAFVFLPAISGTSHCLAFVPLVKTVFLLGASMLPTRWVKISTHLQSERFFSITFILINLKLLIFVHTPNVLCYVVLRYQVRVTSPLLHLFVCLLFRINMLFLPVLAYSLSLTLCCVCP
jgi:hypothetical protein